MHTDDVTDHSSSPERAKEPADAWAECIERQLTDEERFSLLRSVMGSNPVMGERDPRIPEGVKMSAGYVPGIDRLGVPALLMSDASLGVTNPGYRDGDTATALPSGLALGASFNPELAHTSGVMIAREARTRGFNVQLAGGANLIRDPRNGRNFEYLSEDPLLTSRLVAESIKGIQSEGVISTIKHFSLNCNETNRHWLDAVIDPVAHRESDLLAFEMAIEGAKPGAVMTGYNKINGAYAGGNEHLLNDVLKGEWGYPGWVMSDWGATLGWEFANAGLDQESGAQIDARMWSAEAFGDPLREAYEAGELSAERLSGMVRRILRSVHEVGVDRPSEVRDVDMAAHAQIALQTAREGIVLLKNDGDVLPLHPGSSQTIAVIGGHASVGVPTGCGSSAVVPPGGYAEQITVGGPGMMGGGRNLYLLPSSPLRELQNAMPQAQIEYDPGISPGAARLLATRCDVAIVFAHDLSSEGFDNPDLDLPWGQDAVVEAVAKANPNTIVVLETGNPVSMPWIHDVRAVVEAWYPGQVGGQAIAEVLTGAVNPSGHLPLTFPVDLDQHPRPQLTGLGTPWGTPTTIHYNEGAEVGYRWYAQTDQTPRFPFGHGLSYTTFAFSDLRVSADSAIGATLTVTNTGTVKGATTPQLYLTGVEGATVRRLVAFERLDLSPGESRNVSLCIDPRLISRYDAEASRWVLRSGRYRFAVGHSATELSVTAEVELPAS